MSAEQVASKVVLHEGMKRFVTNPFDEETLGDVAAAAVLVSGVPGRTVSDKKNYFAASRLLAIHTERVDVWLNAPLAK